MQVSTDSDGKHPSLPDSPRNRKATTKEMGRANNAKYGYIRKETREEGTARRQQETRKAAGGLLDGLRSKRHDAYME